ncbi:unnamed protein product [Prorocentrum cordatum]|uniref:Uncharacterized protein n=1 Tax=Prorocentrum cordatum TaxID=2364126 RepID=A0ABN9TUA0_9DINO|nr:unnamed protein product [Polarella glacialis]
MEGAGLALLAAAEKMPGEVLLEAAVPFARAGLLSTAPFDLLGPVARHRAVAAAAMPPPVPLGAAGLAPEGSEDASAWPGPPVAAETALDLLLLELGRPDAAGAAPAALVRRLAKYAAWLPAPGGEGGDGLAGPALPAAVLDPLLRRMAEHLVARASALSFADAASALATLAGSGSAPRAVVEALSGAAEARFPAPPCPGAGEETPSCGRPSQPWRSSPGAQAARAAAASSAMG